MPDGVGDKFEASLERGEVEFGFLGVAAPPRWERDWPGVGGVRTPTTWLDDRHDPDRGKVEEGIEGGEDKRRNFERASNVAQIAPPMRPRGRRRKGVD